MWYQVKMALSLHLAAPGTDGYTEYLDLVPEVRLRIMIKEKHTASEQPLKAPPLSEDRLEIIQRLLYHTVNPGHNGHVGGAGTSLGLGFGWQESDPKFHP